MSIEWQFCTMDNAGPDGATFFKITGFCNFTVVKSSEVCTVYWTTGYFSKTKQLMQQDASSGPRARRSRVPFITLDCLDGQKKFAKFDHL